jgi:hypothetical protein
LQYTSITGNPFGVLTAVVAPAILTNASSVLALGTSNRLARVVDRNRVVWAELAKLDPGGPTHQAWTAQLGALQVRAQMLLRALRLFYAGLGLFAATALVSAGLAFLTGASAVAGLACGCILMVRETQLAVRSLEEEARIRTAPKAVNPK